MLVDRYEPEDVFARVPEVAAQTDPVLKELIGCWKMTNCIDRCAQIWGSATATRWCMGDTPPPWK
jgi:hypothetical protein